MKATLATIVRLSAQAEMALELTIELYKDYQRLRKTTKRHLYRNPNLDPLKLQTSHILRTIRLTEGCSGCLL